jgi:cytoskeletal protein CcmA (bactofilin family)
MATSKNFITEDTTIKGTVTTASSLTVAGAIEGDVNAGGDIEILEDAMVKGDLSGPNVKIDGSVEGRITASGRLVIGASGRVLGDISVRSLLIEEGGTLEGQCHMARSSDGASTGTTSNSTSTPPPIPVPAPPVSSTTSS